MAKPYCWNGKTAHGSTIEGFAHSEEDAKARADSVGCVEFHVEENPEYTDSDAISDASPEVSGQTAADAALKNKTDIQVLAEANATLFNQVDGLKNQIATLEMERDAATSASASYKAMVERGTDAKALILAWNSEQIAHAAAENREYHEPAFMEIVRALA